MSHYYDEELAKVAEDLRMQARIQRGEVATVTTCDDFEPFHDVEEPEDLVHTPEDNIVDMLALDMDGDYPLIEGLPGQELKETTGKAEGARYCYLGEHSILTNKNQYFNLETILKSLVEAVDEEAYFSARHIVEVALQAVRDLDDDFLTNLITVRAHALSSGKYTLDSYREEIDINLLLDATARHLLKILHVGDIDEESGVHHLGHIAANLIMIDVQLRLYHG